ncbi:MAG: SpoIIE family protein phosphatase [Spirochaetales bacterium]|nr:SpoIIE family protein phosphatase [Spirochaetales bacterium]
MERKKLVQTPELKVEYSKEQSETLWKINRVVAPITIIIPVVLIMFSDSINFPNVYREMFVGRIYAIVLGFVVVISSLVPKLKNRGHIFSFLLFLGFSLMAAHLSAVMNNENSSLTNWILTTIIGCGILPISLSYTSTVVIISFIYYLLVYFNLGFLPDVAFRMTLINVGSASVAAMAFKVAQFRIREREFFFRKSLRKANGEIEKLNEKLKDENVHLTTELEVAKHIQTIVLPQKEEYASFEDLDISCLMIPADEVGGDYYDTISFGKNGIITMGDVTDHGLHSGLIMMMVHTAIRALSQIEKNDIKRIFEIINKLLFDFRHKTSDHRIMTLLILKYEGVGQFTLTGQHESLLIISPDGSFQDLSLLDYGMFAGLEENVTPYLDTLQFEIKKDDVLILYTDGITEAMNSNNEEFGKGGIIKAAVTVRKRSADKIKRAIIDNCLKHVGHEKLHDDMSIMIIKKIK